MPPTRAQVLRRPVPAPSNGDRIRQPRQERGERRVVAILDAAAALIAEGGADRLTVQALADRARTSKGSLYHFFPDLPSVLCALADRHTAAITALTDAMLRDAGLDWRALTIEQTVDCFLAPLVYLEAHPDLLALVRAPVIVRHDTRRLMPIRALADRILRVRCPALTPRRRLACASTMVALLDGIVGYMLRSDEVDPRRMVVELKRVLSAYLVAVEAIRRGS
jgi:AcrR family transcriptional regulator